MPMFCMKEADTYRKTLGNQLPHMEFVLDGDYEIHDLPTNTTAAEVGGEMVGPCAPGSVALVPSQSLIFMLDCAGGWHQM